MKKEILELLGGIVLMVLFILYSAFSWGFVTYKFWDWFVLPVFTTAPVLSYCKAVGLSLFIGLFKGRSAGIRDEFKESKIHQTFHGIIAPWLLLLLAAFVRLFI